MRLPKLNLALRDSPLNAEQRDWLCTAAEVLAEHFCVNKVEDVDALFSELVFRFDEAEDRDKECLRHLLDQ